MRALLYAGFALFAVCPVTYEILGPDEFIETFEPAPPDKPFEVYSKNHFRRQR